MTTVVEPQTADVDGCPSIQDARWMVVRAAQQGSRAAFARLYELHRGAVFGYIRGRVPDAALAEDLTSETFARAFAKIESFSFQGKDFRAWLCTIARNLVIDHGRSKYARTLLVGDYEPGWEQAAPVDVESVVVRGHIVADLCRRLEDLTEGQRECLRLRFALDYSVAETAAVMKRDIRAVRQLQHRAVLRLGSSMREAWA